MQFTARIVERHAIHQDQRCSALRTTRVKRRERSGRSVLGNLHSGNVTKYVGQHRISEILHPLFGDHIGRDGRLFGRGLVARRGNYYCFHRSRHN